MNNWFLLASCALAAGCISDTGEPNGTLAQLDDPFASSIATLMDLEFDGEVIASSNLSLASKVRAQLIYAVGHLNQENGVARLNAVVLTGLSATPIAGGLYRIRYHAKLPVAWGSKDDLPASYTLTLPKRVDATGQANFLAKYGASCTEHDGHELSSANVWYYYRPGTPGCSFAPGDVSVSVASATVSPLNTVAKYPEYHRIWEDEVLDVVAVFGKYQKGAQSPYDAGIAAYDEFVGAVQAMFPEAATTPLDIPDGPGVAAPDITFDIETEDGRVSIVTLLVDEVVSAPASFNARFAEATPRADLILYGGHAGLGANVRSLTQKARFFPQKYQLFFLNGCDTFAYEDDTLVNARKLLNPSDPSGDKYMDVMRNAMPSYFHAMSDASLAVIDAALDRDAPRTYEEIFDAIDREQVVLVTGEEKNEFTPELDLNGRWEGMSEAGAVGYKQSLDYATATLAAGKYVFELGPEASFPGGDADLFLRVGAAPSATAAYKCPSYKWNSNERCLITLTQPAKVFLKARGDQSSLVSPFELRAWRRFE